MSNQRMRVDWTICEHDTEWEDVRAVKDLPRVERASRLRALPRRMWACLLAGLLVLTVTAAWMWRAALAGLHQVNIELDEAVEQELWALQEGRSDLAVALAVGPRQAPLAARRQQEYALLEQAPRVAASNTHVSANSIADVQIVQLQGEQAVVRLLLDIGDETFRQIRFYQHTGGRWLQIAPQADLLDDPLRVQTHYLTLYYFNLDAAYVADAVPKIDALAAQMRADYGLSLDGEHPKYTFAIAPARDFLAHHATSYSRTMANSRTMDKAIFVDSPSLLLLPVSVAPSDAIVQSAAYHLGHLLLEEAREQQGARWRAAASAWLPLMRAFHLWEFWQSDIPLASLQEDIRRLALERYEFPNRIPQRSLDAYYRICNAFQMWEMKPLVVWIPLTCVGPMREPFVTVSMPNRLRELHAPEIYCCAAAEGLRVESHTVGLTTVLDYVVAIYGRDRLPILLTALGEHATWDDLIPAVFGVSAAEFERGWQEHLQARYDLVGR